MKKIVSVVTAVLLLGISGCGKKEEESYLGTWEATSVKMGDSSFDKDEWETISQNSLEDAILVVKEGGKIYISSNGFVGILDWKEVKDGIAVEDVVFKKDKDTLCMVSDSLDYSICYKKESSSQTIPSKEEIEEEKSETEEAVLPTTQPEETTEPEETIVPEETEEPTKETASGLRPEFVEAMDAYEEFYTEYCAVIKQMEENPSDLTLMGEYASLLAKEAEVDKKFNAWDSETMNEEETLYYLDVQNRMMKLLVSMGE